MSINTHKIKMDQSYLFIGLAIIIFLLLFLGILLVKQNRHDESIFRSRKRSRFGNKGMPSGIAIGIGIGMAIGVALDNIAIGIAIGVAIGVAIGTSLGISFEAASKKDKKQNHLNRASGHNKMENSRNTIVLGLMAVLVGILVLGIMIYFTSK